MDEATKKANVERIKEIFYRSPKSRFTFVSLRSGNIGDYKVHLVLCIDGIFKETCLCGSYNPKSGVLGEEVNCYECLRNFENFIVK